MPYVKTGGIDVYRYEPNKPKWPGILAGAVLIAFVGHCIDEDNKQKRLDQLNPLPESSHVYTDPSANPQPPVEPPDTQPIKGAGDH
jgi:hypothetical protein